MCQMTKEEFIKKMKLIQNFMSEQDTLQALINKLTDGFCVPTIGDYLVTELLDMISDKMNIKYDDLFYWWLYEDVDKIIYVDDREIDVGTLEKLYDYIISEYSKED